MFSPPDKETLDRLSDETGYIRDTLEKAYRLIAILGDLQRTRDLEGKIALKGGTALQFIYLGFRRLSVDIDFNYVASVQRASMESDRITVRAALLRLFKQQGYELDDERNVHAEHSFTLAYRNSAGNRDRIKVEINYLERLSAMGIELRKVHHPFATLGEVTIPSYHSEELFAMKTRALLARATPRDLFDVNLIAFDTEQVDQALYRKLCIFYLCMSPGDVRRETTGRILGITESDVKRHLVPLLRKGGSREGLADMKKKAMSHLDAVLTFREDEKRFLDTFYDEHRFDQGKLFGDFSVSPNLKEHPAIVWRLQHLK